MIYTDCDNLFRKSPAEFNINMCPTFLVHFHVKTARAFLLFLLLFYDFTLSSQVKYRRYITCNYLFFSMKSRRSYLDIAPTLLDASTPFLYSINVGTLNTLLAAASPGFSSTSTLKKSTSPFSSSATV